MVDEEMSIKGKSVLVIDDDAAMLRALNKVLRSEGAIVTSASWAGDAMDHLTDKFERFDLIITDLRMPILGGETILRAVALALPEVPIIIITAFGTPELKAECLHKGAAAFLEKPLNTSQLLEAVERAFSPRRDTSRRPARSGTKGENISRAGAEDDEGLVKPNPRTGS